MGLIDDIDNLWTKDRQELAKKWATDLKKHAGKAKIAASKFHEWNPLYAYLSYSRATSPQIKFSLRYRGQEVADIHVNETSESVDLFIGAKTKASNKKYFEIEKQGTFSWNGKDATQFRKEFKALNHPPATLRSPEHEIESALLRDMMKNSSRGKCLKNIQPILFAGCPFQFPLPISGSSGKPKPTKGNIDILARRGTGKGTKISIWELKKPRSTGKAIEQAYIYAVTLLKMLRLKESGQILYKDIFGFKGDVPNKLTIESIVAVSIPKGDQGDYIDAIKDFRSKNSHTVGGDVIKSYVAFYDYNRDNGSLSKPDLV